MHYVNYLTDELETLKKRALKIILEIKYIPYESDPADLRILALKFL